MLFAMIFFGLMALAALVIDMGFARLAQRQMQTAVDSAALEGLRQLYNPSFAAGPDAYRQQQASAIATQVFTDPSGAVQYGAGPVVEFTGGIGPADAVASQTLAPSSPYQPALQTNTATPTVSGDMVPGTYAFNPFYGSNGTTEAADEDANYNRRDFTPASDAAAAQSALAFLVRMRRVNPTAADQQSGCSFGPPLPFLFGRGSLMARSGTSGQLSVASGITVRATAIAAAGTAQFTTSSGTTAYSVGLAKTVGRALTISGTAIPGHGPFALSSSVWPTLAQSGGTLTASGGTLTMTGGTGGSAPDGLILSATGDGSSLSATGVSSIGQPVSSATDSSTLSQSNGPRCTCRSTPVSRSAASLSRLSASAIWRPGDGARLTRLRSSSPPQAGPSRRTQSPLRTPPA